MFLSKTECASTLPHKKTQGALKQSATAAGIERLVRETNQLSLMSLPLERIIVNAKVDIPVRKPGIG